MARGSSTSLNVESAGLCAAFAVFAGACAYAPVDGHEAEHGQDEAGARANAASVHGMIPHVNILLAIGAATLLMNACCIWGSLRSMEITRCSSSVFGFPLFCHNCSQLALLVLLDDAVRHHVEDRKLRNGESRIHDAGCCDCYCQTLDHHVLLRRWN